jgi:hypothetical protein
MFGNTMTVSDDHWGDMADLDDDLVDRLLDGTVANGDVPRSLGRVATLVRSAQSSATSEELAGEDQIVTAMEEIILDARGRRDVVGRALVAKAVALVTLGSLAVAAAAATGGVAGLWFDSGRPDPDPPAVTVATSMPPAPPMVSDEGSPDADAEARPPTDASECAPPAAPSSADHVERLRMSSCPAIPPATPSVTLDGVPPASPPPAAAEPNSSGPSADAHQTIPAQRPAPTAPAEAPPGQSGSAPGHAETSPGQSGTAPGQAETTPGQGATPPGHGGSPPGQAGTTPGRGDTAPGLAETAPGRNGAAPGQSGAAPDQPEGRGSSSTSPDPAAAPGWCGAAPGPGGCP